MTNKEQTEDYDPEELIGRFKNEICRFKADSSLTYLHKLCVAKKKQDADFTLKDMGIDDSKSATDVAIEFIAKWLILGSSNFSPREMDSDTFEYFHSFYFELTGMTVSENDDPKDILRKLIPLLDSQIQSQKFIAMQHFSLAYRLFYEIPRRMVSEIDYDIPQALSDIWGVNVPTLLKYSFLFYTACMNNIPLRKPALDAAIQTDMKIDEETTYKCLDRISADYDTFREVSNSAPFTVGDHRYFAFEFNPLKLKPLIEFRSWRFAAPNSDLIIRRTSSGLYHELLTQEDEEFTKKFGYVFQRYIGQLFSEAYSDRDNLIPELSYGQKKGESKQGPADWTVIENDMVVFGECKAIVPPLPIKQEADKDRFDYYSDRIVEAICQTHNHVRNIGEYPRLDQFTDKDYIYLIITFEPLYGVSGSFILNDSIRRKLDSCGIDVNYHVVDVWECEAYLSCVNRGSNLSDILLEKIKSVDGDDNTFQEYQQMMNEDALLPSTKRTWEKISESILPDSYDR